MPAPPPAEERLRGPQGATAAVRAGAAGAEARDTRRARRGRKSLAPWWWSAWTVRPGALAVLSAAAKRAQVAEGARVLRWRHGSSHSTHREEWSRTSRRALPQRPLQFRRARPIQWPTNASSDRTRARSIVAGWPHNALGSSTTRPMLGRSVAHGREGTRPNRLVPAFLGDRPLRRPDPGIDTVTRAARFKARWSSAHL